MSTTDVKLLGGWPSPFVMRARIALNIKSVDYEFLREKLGEKGELLLKSNPVYKKIPVLIHVDKPICESLIIVQYIDEVWTSSPSILPSDPYDRAIARFWAAYIDDKWFPSVIGIAFIVEGDEAKKEALEQVAAGLELLEDAFTKCSKGSNFFGGERIGYLDIALGCFLAWLRVTEKLGNVKLLDEAKTPNLCKWAECFCSDAAVKGVMPETDWLSLNHNIRKTSHRSFHTGSTSFHNGSIRSLSTSDLPSDDPITMLNRIHPPRPDWYEELYALVLNKATKSYENEIAGYKSELFANLREKADKIVEIGIGTGPNLKYYASDSSVNVFGIDPIRKMEKYAQAAAETVGLPPSNFKFIQAVAEALPLSDASVDAVVGTLVLCSVKDVDKALQEVRRVLKPGGLYIFVEHVAAKDGTFLRFVQGVLNPLQRTVADGCHLTRKTEKSISEAGFSSVDINTAFLSTAMLAKPHVYGIARK